MPEVFHPRVSSTVTLAVTNASARVALVNPAKGPFQVRVINDGSAVAFICQGDVTVVAVAATDLPIMPGAIEVFTIISSPVTPVTHIAAITAAGTANLRISVGEGG